MFSIRAAVFFAATAFTAFTSAAPASSSQSTGPVNVVTPVGNNGVANVGIVDNDIELGRREVVSVSAILGAAVEAVVAIQADLHVQVDSGIKLDVDACVGILAKIEAVVAVAVDSCNAIVAKPVDSALDVVGGVVDLTLIAEILIKLFVVISACISLVLKISINVDACLPAITGIVNILLELVHLVIHLLPGCLSILAGLIVVVQADLVVYLAPVLKLILA